MSSIRAAYVAAMIVASCLVSSCSGKSYAMTDVFPDESLRACVANELGIDVSGVVTGRQLDSMRRLTCDPDHPVRVLDGLSLLRNLRELTLRGVSGVQVSADEIGDLGVLQRLYLSSMELDSVDPISELDLTELYMARSAPVSFDGTLGFVSDMDQLERLDLDFWSTLSSLDGIENLASLEKLSVAGTSVTFFDRVSSLPALKELTVGYTSIDDLGFLTGLDLRMIDFSGTGVVDVSQLAGMNSLLLVGMSDTAVESVEPFNSCPSLAVIYAEHTHVTDWSSLDRLDEIDVVGVSTDPAAPDD